MPKPKNFSNASALAFYDGFYLTENILPPKDISPKTYVLTLEVPRSALKWSFRFDSLEKAYSFVGSMLDGKKIFVQVSHGRFIKISDIGSFSISIRDKDSHAKR